MKFLERIAPICAVAMLAGCSGSGNGQNFVPVIATITLSNQSPALLVGEHTMLTATARDASGNVINGRTLLWASQDVSLATVTSAGLVTAIDAGRVQITATAGAVVGRTEIEILDESPVGGPVAAVELTPSAARIVEGDSFQFNATPLDAAGGPLTGRGITWSVLDPDIATVSPGGIVTGLRSGSTRVDVKVEGKTASAGVTIDSAHTHGLLYSQTQGIGAAELYTLDINDPAGSEVRIVLSGTASSDPSASPDGKRIAYVVQTPVDTAIYAAYRAGGTGVRLTTAPGAWDQPAWSPDGTRIAFRGRLPGRDADIWVMTAEGTGAISLTIGHGATNQSSPAWSPEPIDGAYRIAYSHSQNGMGHLWTMRADGTDKQQVTSSTTDYDDMPSYSPDGSQLVFLRSGPGIFGDLYVVGSTGGAVRALTPLIGPLAGPQFAPAWSPDGKLIAFASRHADEYYQIYTVWADGTRVVRRSSDPFDHSSPTWLLLE